MATYAKPNRHELQERIFFLELTLAALQTQLDKEDPGAGEAASKAQDTGAVTVRETPLAIAAG